MPKIEVAWDSYLNETTDCLPDGLLLASLHPSTATHSTRDHLTKG